MSKPEQPKPARNRELALIHMGRVALGMDEDTYRAMLFTVRRVRSAADLDHAGRAAVLDHMKQRGFKPAAAAKHGRRPKVGADRQAMLAKIEALLTETKRPWGYAESMARQMFGIERLEFVGADQMHKLLAALLVDQRRRKARTERAA